MDFLLFYRQVIESLINLINCNRNYIPFSNTLIGYLRLPIFIKLIIGLFLGGISISILYNIGYIILQSKAKDEVLSLITAYQNPINFSNQLVWFYSFIFCILFFFTILPFVVGFIFYRYIRSSLIPDLNSRIVRRSWRVLIYLLIFVLFILCETLVIYLLFYCIPLIPYVMLYQSKDPSVLVLLFKYIFNKEEIVMNSALLNYERFRIEVMMSLTLGNLCLLASIFLLYIFWLLFNRIRSETIKTITIASTTLIFLLIILMIIFSHTFYQWGNFGKNLAQFDLDYIRVEYIVNGEMQIYEGNRIFQDKNYIVIRTPCNGIHYIFSDNMHVNSVIQKPVCNSM